MAEPGFEIAPPLPHLTEYREEDAEALARCWREGASAWPGGGPGRGLATAATIRAGLSEWDTLAMFLAWAPDAESGQPRVVGYCWLTPFGAEPRTGYVHILGVLSDYHGRGLGRDLLKAALARSVALGHDQLNLHTWSGNQRAVPLYKRSGYFWAPDTSVRMENYLPTIFRLPDARRFFTAADWYGDFARDGVGVLRPDGELYRYAWERDGRRLAVTIDRRARAVVALESPERELALRVPAAVAPLGSSQPVALRVVSRRAEAVAAFVEGRDGVELRMAVDGSGPAAEAGGGAATTDPTASAANEWPGLARVERAGDGRVEATVLLDGEETRLAATLRADEPVAIDFDRRRWLTPGLAQPYWVTVENRLEQPVAGELRLSAGAGLAIDRDQLAFELGPRERAGLRLSVCAAGPGSHALHARARVRLPDGGERETAGADGRLHCGQAGALLVEQGAERVTVATDRLLVEVPLRGDPFGPRMTLRDRASGRPLLEHGCALGLPFWPASASVGELAARIEPGDGATTLVLSAPSRRPAGLAFEWRVRIASSGLLRVTYRVANAGSEPRTLQVGSFTEAELTTTPAARVALPLASGLVVDEPLGFPDWLEPTTTRPERYAEGWMALFGDGWVAGTLWSRARDVIAWHSLPGLTLDLGTVQPGQEVESAPLWLYAGPGDWSTVRALWRQQVAPEAPAEDPRPRPALLARLERFAGEGDALETHVALTSERFRPLDGRVAVEVVASGESATDGDGSVAGRGVDLAAGAARAGPAPTADRAGTGSAGAEIQAGGRARGRDGWREIGGGAVEGLRLGATASIALRLPLPAAVGAAPAALALAGPAGRERWAAALIRAGDGRSTVAVEPATIDGVETVVVDNRRLRLRLAPSQVGRAVELSVDGVNQLWASWPEPGAFVRNSPWFGGLHPVLRGEAEGWWSYPGKLGDERFDWAVAERVGGQGVRWRGARLSCQPTAPALAGLRVGLEYLLTGGGNLLGLVARVENRGRAPWRGQLDLSGYLQPGGDRRRGELLFRRGGERRRGRVHDEQYSDSEGWCAVAGPDGPALALVAAGGPGRVAVADLGLEGAHPRLGRAIELEPGGSAELCGYLVVAGSVEEARLYAGLGEQEGLI